MISQYYQFVVCNGHIYNINPQQSIIQMALSKLGWPDIYDKAEKLAKKYCHETLYFKWR